MSSALATPIRPTSSHADQEYKLLSPSVLDFVRELDLKFGAERVNLLSKRKARQMEFDNGKLPDFLESTAWIRASEWRVAPPPAELLDRRVEITGPPERKMVINALNCGAKVFMADFEDSSSPTWENCIAGQQSLYEANCRQISFTSPEGKQYRLNDQPVVLFVRPRGLHMDEVHCKDCHGAVSASLFDFGVYFANNYEVLRQRGSAPYFYIPKLESHEEARLWNNIFNFAEDKVGLKRGTIRATALIETITAAFEMDEILYELREHSVGLNCGRWDYIFSFIKKFSARPDFILPQRGDVTMDQPFLASYVRLLIDTCHRRGAHAMGGMAAQIPIKNDPEVNREAIDRVRKDKLREVMAGHDGTWVAHPGLVSTAMDVFNEYMPGPNQIDRPATKHEPVTAADLLTIPNGHITDLGFRRNVDISLMYLESWLRGQGCVPIYNLMEDAATAEISRAQLWQWNHYGVHTDDGRLVDTERIRAAIQSFLADKKKELGDGGFAKAKFSRAAEILLMLSTGSFREFLTTELYGDLH
ncbi:malate synthase [Bryocella elongata]|uniref:Malate synthase n=1 Tax=Bryocella elongata TaxID=863522 RepID=A0A1H5UUD3_9BACT|nr:malate synthase A [Bryocella elongata]SEF78675.1 malate synthase [Bryocella elongata]